ncbi:MAG: phosphotransferase [Pseudomonadota bacterium]
MAEPDFTAVALLEHLKLAPAGASWQLVSVAGAHSNRVWRASAPGARDCIVKHHQADAVRNPLFGNDAAVERAAAEATPTSLAPRLLGAWGDWSVWPCVAGGRFHAPERAAQQLRAVHDLSPWTGLSVVAGTPRAWVEQGLDMLDRVATDNEAVAALRASAPEVGARPHACTVIHRDPHPGNWVGGDAAVLVDWQCVALGNPHEDLACYLARGMRLAYGFPPAPLWEAARFLAAAGVTLDATWIDTQAAYDFRFACYCAWREQTVPGTGQYAAALADYVSRAVPVSNPSIDRPLRSRQ